MCVYVYMHVFSGGGSVLWPHVTVKETAQLFFFKLPCRNVSSHADDFILAERPSHASPAGLYDAIPSLNVPNILCTAQ